MHDAADANPLPETPGRLSLLLARIGNSLAETPYWALSAALHFVLVALLLSPREQPPPARPQRTLSLRFPGREDKPLERPARKQPREMPQIPAPALELPAVEPRIEPPKGTAVAEILLRSIDVRQQRVGGDSALSAAYAHRRSKGSLAREGGSGKTENAVTAALDWLVRHQSADGSWSAAGFVKHCEKTCRNREPRVYGDGRGGTEYDVGVTALAMLAFSGYGVTHKEAVEERHRTAMRRAVGFLKAVQVDSLDPTVRGRYGLRAHRKWIYDHSMATLAMAEVLLMSGDQLGLRRSVQEAVGLCLRAQNRGAGWRYGYRPGDDDVSVTGWVLFALKTARSARLGVDNESFDRAFRDALGYIHSATTPGGITGYKRAGDHDNVFDDWRQTPYPFGKETSCMTAVGVLCRLLGGEPQDAPMVRKGVEVLLRQPPTWREIGGRRPSTINFYHWYYASYALFQFGGKAWETWNQAMQATLLSSQRTDAGCEKGSWDPVGEWSQPGGRVYSTALAAMTLEVYYRYQRATFSEK